MHPIHDFDALLLLAVALAAKRRPASLQEIMAAADVLERVPPEAILAEAFNRLAANGLLQESEGAYRLSAAGEQSVSGIPAKATKEARIAQVTEYLQRHRARGEYAPIIITSVQYKAALAVHRAAAKSPVKNVLMPKPKKDSHFKVDGQWRRVSGTARAARKAGSRGR